MTQIDSLFQNKSGLKYVAVMKGHSFS